MAHMISTTSGTAEMVWAGLMPWHSLGLEISKDMPLSDALILAHGDWETEIVPTYRLKKNGEYEQIPMRMATVRPDTDTLLGSVGTRYAAIHNPQVRDFILALTSESEIEVETIGFLGVGERNFWCLRIKGDIEVKPGDTVKRYLIVSNSHDGSSSMRVFWSPIRVVCNNTLAIALGKADKEGVSIRHTTNATQRIAEAKRILGLAFSEYELVAERYKKLAAVKVPDKATLDVLLADIFPIEKDATDKQKSDIAEDKRQIAANIAQEAALLRPGQKGISRWDVLNGVTYYTSHQQIKSAHGKTGQAERRFDSVINGRGAELAGKAMQILLTRDGKEIEVPIDTVIAPAAPIAPLGLPILDSMLSN